MNIYKILLFIFLSVSTLSAQKTKSISFKIDGYTEGVAQLVGIYADANYLADSAKIAPDGSMIFNSKDTIGYKDGLFFLLLPDKANIQFLVANGENFKVTSKRSNLLGALQVEGSLENQLFFEGQKYQADMEQRFNIISQTLRQTQPNTPQYETLKKQQNELLADRDAKIKDLQTKYPNAFVTKFKIAGQNPPLRYVYRPNGALDSVQTMYNYKSDWWKDYDFSDARLIHTPVFFNKLKKYMYELTPQSPDSVIAAADYIIGKSLDNKSYFNFTTNWITYNFKPGVGKLMDGDAVYSHLVLKYFTAEKANWIGQPITEINSMRKTAKDMQVSLVGMTGQDVSCANAKGEFKSIYGLKAKFTVVFIYNPECEHCQEETPHLRQVYDQWKSRGVEVYSIAANAKSMEEWQGFAKKYGVNWTDVWDPPLQSRYHEKYYVDITPECYVLDKNHKIIAKNLKPFQLPEIFERELAKENK